MVDSINQNSTQLQRIQQIAIANLKSNRNIAQTVLNQGQAGAVKPIKLTAVPQSTKAEFSKTLPRGSLVDITT